MSWYCKHCNKKINDLKYNVNVSSTEYGDANLSEEKVEPDDMIDDYNYSDSGDTEWDGSPTYRCPECDKEITIEKLIWKDNEEEIKEKAEKRKKEQEEEPEEFLHNIITPKNNIMSKEIPKRIKTIICKKCFHPYIYDTNRFSRNNDETYDCPKCGTSNTPEENTELINTDYFNNKEK